MVVDIPKDVQFQTGTYHGPQVGPSPHLPAQDRSRPVGDREGGGDDGGGQDARSSIPAAASSIPARKRRKLLRELVDLTGFPITSTLMGLGAFPASRPEWLGMLGMHGTWEANHAMHDCDLMICLGARFDDRVTGKVSAFSPKSKKIHLDIDASQINKIVRVDLGIVADATKALREMIRFWKTQKHQVQTAALKDWWKQIEHWRGQEVAVLSKLRHASSSRNMPSTGCMN